MKAATIFLLCCTVLASAAAAQSADYRALVKAAHDAVDQGEAAANDEQRAALYTSAEDYARRAVAANPKDVDGHFELARALGRHAQMLGPRDRVKYAGEVRTHALDALAIDPKHGGALHIMGLWNAEIMRLNGVVRLIAKNFLGGRVFGEASWDNAQRYLEEAAAAEPTRITHRLDLARVYRDRDDKAKAREQYEWIARATPGDPNDAKYKSEAARELEAIRG